MKPSSLVARVAVAALLAVGCRSGFALDLVESYRRAQGIDPDILAAREALAAGREQAVQGDARLKPQLGLSASLARGDERSDAAELPAALAGAVPERSAGTTHQLAIQLKQPLYDARARADRDQLRQQADLAELTHRHAQQALMQRVATRYFGVLLAQESLRVVRAEQAAVGAQRDRAQARFDVGRGKVTELQEAQARVDAVATREVAAQGTLAQREAQFRELTGAAADALAPLAPGFVPLPPQPDSLAAWQLKGEESNTAVQRRRGELAIASAETAKHRLSGRPTLDLVASLTDRGRHGGSAGTLEPQRSRAATIGLQFSMPLYAGGALDSRERESLARARQAEQELSGARRDARLQVQDGFLAVKTGAARIASLEQSLRSARTALEATTLGRDLGTRTELDVLDAQQRVFGTELDLAQARHDYLLGRLDLSAAAGELQEADLRALNGYLEK